MRIHTFLAAVMLAAPAFADVVHLQDGTTLTGDLRKAADGWFVTPPGGGKAIHVSTEQVRSIELARGDPKDVAVGRLASLRRSVEALTDLKLIVDRFEKFVEQNKGLPIAEDAKKDLGEWRERQAKGMVKVGGKWVAPEEKAALQEKALLVADQARDLLKQAKLRDADAAVTRALEVDPTNVSALYLKGLIAYRQDQMPVARKAFETVREVMPDHGPALNNLAVIQWRQNQQMAAMGTYFQAMQAMPLNKELLGNVAEALNALTPEQRKSQIAQKVLRLWTEQDAQFQQQMMLSGWYRWGSTWVDKAQFEKLQVAEKEVKDKIAKLEDEFAEAQSKIDSIDSQIQQNRLAMRYMENQRMAYDASGRPTLYPLPAAYFEYDRANRRLEIQRTETLKLLDALRAKAQVVKGQLPVPKFSGVQLVVGVEGTPAIPPIERPAAPDRVQAPGNLLDEIANKPGDAPEKVAGGSKPENAPRPAEKPLKY